MKKKIFNLAKLATSRMFYLCLGIGLVLGVYAVNAWSTGLYTGGNPESSGYTVGTGTNLTAALWNGLINKVDALNNRPNACSWSGYKCGCKTQGSGTVENYVITGIECVSNEITNIRPEAGTSSLNIACPITAPAWCNSSYTIY